VFGAWRRYAYQSAQVIYKLSPRKVCDDKTLFEFTVHKPSKRTAAYID
jgi:hypothetical protein